ncbi:MAG: CS domain-containing protein [Methanolinea sp.]|nr:CS domain-containing protein [Methanolinea sp.]
MPSRENPYDEFIRNLARMVEDLLKNMPQDETPHIIGCTIITGNGPNPPPFLFNTGQQEEEEISFEVIDAPDRVFVTARLPVNLQSAPYADITPDSLHIVVNERRTKVQLPCRVDVIHSFYQVRHGVIDIILKKKPVNAASAGIGSG